MSSREKTFQAAEALIALKPFDQITFAEIAAMTGVHWTAVRRHFGSKEAMRSWLEQKQAEQNSSFQDTRTRVLLAATELFAAQGYVNASLDKVAAKAGMSKGAVYWHFSSKQDMFLAILEQNLAKDFLMLSTQIEAVITADDPRSAIGNWLDMLFSNMDSGAFMLFLEFVLSSREPEIQVRLQKIYSRTLEGIGNILKGLQEKGYFASDLDPFAIGLMIDSLVKGIMMEYLIDPRRLPSKEILETVSRVLWSGLAPKHE